MQKIIFSSHKHKILEFEAETLEFEPQDTSLVVHAEGVMVYQDTPALTDITSEHSYNVQILKDAETVLEGLFSPTFFVLEPDQLVVSLG